MPVKILYAGTYFRHLRHNIPLAEDLFKKKTKIHDKITLPANEITV
jgi:hypothetical protein